MEYSVFFVAGSHEIFRVLLTLLRSFNIKSMLCKKACGRRTVEHAFFDGITSFFRL